MIRFKLKELIALKEREEGRRIGLQEIADATDIHRTTLSKLQNPNGYNTNTENLDKLCTYFGCELSDLAEHVALETM